MACVIRFLGIMTQKVPSRQGDLKMHGTTMLFKPLKVMDHTEGPSRQKQEDYALPSPMLCSPLAWCARNLETKSALS